MHLLILCSMLCFSAQMNPVKAKSHARGVVFEEVLTIDLEEDGVPSQPKTKTSQTTKSKQVLI